MVNLLFRLGLSRSGSAHWAEKRAGSELNSFSFYIFNKLKNWILVAGHGCFLVMLGERISIAFVGKSGGIFNLKASYVFKY